MDERIYRKLTLSDLNIIMKMNDDFKENYYEKNVTQFLTNPMNWIFTCIQNNRIVGFAYGYEMNRLDNKGNMLYIHGVGVLSDYQKQGIGFTILTEIKKLCSITGICKVFLFTQKHNVAACALYEKVGGEKTQDSHDDDVTYFFVTK